MNKPQPNPKIEFGSFKDTPVDIDFQIQMNQITGTPVAGDEIRDMATGRCLLVEKRVWIVEANGDTVLTLMVKPVTGK